MGKEINIQIIDKCQLNCKWCARRWINEDELEEIEKRYMDFSTFSRVVQRCTDYGIDEFCLTPKMGELFLNPTIYDKLDHLEANDKVKRYFFSTNFLAVDIIDILRLFEYKKLFLDVSIYGHDRKSYRRNTDKDMFDIFMENMNILFRFCEASKMLGMKFTIRFPKHLDEFPNSRLKHLLHFFYKIYKYEIDETEMYNFNWGGLIPYDKLDTLYGPFKKKGRCPTAEVGCILHNGDFALCYMNDAFNTTVIDNVFEHTLEEIYNSERYKRILSNQDKNIYTGICKRCDERWHLWTK
jgi:MoaA/NifB/PqqE/SkfB family radical SAM enzyme